MEKGEIYKGTKRGRKEAYHPIVFLESRTNGSFIGGVLTHSGHYGNIRMKREYFEENDSSGNKYNLCFDNTYLVLCRFVKPMEWGPYSKIGKLTKEGIKFIDEKISKLSPKIWEDYILDHNYDCE